jgi:hypothetical protein
MSKRKKLTSSEFMKVQQWAYEREKEKFPDTMVTIEVEDELDENGKVHYTANKFTEMPS